MQKHNIKTCTKNDANPPTTTGNTVHRHTWPLPAAGPPTACTTGRPGKCIHSRLRIAKCGFCKPCHNNAMSTFGRPMRCPTHADHRTDHIPRGTKRPRNSLQHTPHQIQHPSPPHSTAIKQRTQGLPSWQPDHQVAPTPDSGALGTPQTTQPIPAFTFTTPVQTLTVPKVPIAGLPPPEPPPPD